MANQTLRRQIDRIKTELDVMKPKDPTRITILLESDPAVGDNLLDSLLAVREAKKTHDHVLVACYRWNDPRAGQTLDGVRYFENDFAALCLKAKLLRTGDLREFALSCCGNVFGPGPGLPAGVK